MSTLQIDFGHAKPRIVGIDLGTTNSLVAVMDLTGPRILSGIVPSVVSVTESGEVIAEYSSGVSGEVSAYRTDATSEPGNLLMSVLYNRTPPDRIDPLPE